MGAYPSLRVYVYTCLIFVAAVAHCTCWARVTEAVASDGSSSIEAALPVSPRVGDFYKC